MKILLQNIQQSLDFIAKHLTQKDIKDIYNLLRDNQEYTSIINKPSTLGSASEILTDLPPGKAMEDKLVVGFYDNDELIGLVDLVRDYPDTQHVFIGLLLLSQARHNQGIGSKVVSTICQCFKSNGFCYCDIGVIDKNKKALAFWQKNGFCKNGTVYNHPDCNAIMLTKQL